MYLLGVFEKWQIGNRRFSLNIGLPICNFRKIGKKQVVLARVDAGQL